MIKNFIKRKFIVTTLAFSIFLLTLLFPNKNTQSDITITNITTKSTPIFLLNKESYVAKINVPIKENELLNEIHELLTFLTIDSKNELLLPNNFKALIPKNTKIISLDIQDNTLKINFSKEFLDIPAKYEKKMLESLIYTLTEIDGIKNIIIMVEGDILDKMPNSKEKIPHILSRNIGINTKYNFNQIKESVKTTAYYIANENNTYYYVPVTLLENNKNDKVEIIIERLKSNPYLETNLMSYLNVAAELENYEILDNEIKLSFNDTLYSGLKNEELQELVEYSLAFSIKDTFNIENVTINYPK